MSTQPGEITFDGVHLSFRAEVDFTNLGAAGSNLPASRRALTEIPARYLQFLK